jgi:hypothetical protein
MLSHPSPSQPEASAVATASSRPRPAAANRRRHLTVGDLLGRFDRAFFREWFIDGPRMLLTGRFTRRAGAFMVASALPSILTALFLTVPGMLFHTPEHHAFFHFAKTLEGDGVSMLPVILGTLSSLFSFRFPLG